MNHRRIDDPCAEALNGEEPVDIILQHSVLSPGENARERCRLKGQELCEQVGANLRDTTISCVPNDSTEGFAYIGKEELGPGDSFFCAQFIYDIDPSDFDTIEKLVVLADSDAMVTLSKNDHEIHYVSCQSDDAADWNLDYLDRSDRENFEYDAADGTGVTAYVIDTGVNADHEDFEGRVIGGWNLVENNDDFSDNDGHGTHVAGTIASKTYGVAKKASIWGVQIFFSNGLTSSSLIISAISSSVQRALQNTSEKSVINLSLGGGTDSGQDNAVNAANNNGIPVVVASGNSAENACTTSPARASEAITVSSHTSAGAWSGFSNFGSCVDIIAPGTGIRSLSANSNTGTNLLSGTSMAAPHVSGVIAQIMSRTQITDPATIKEMLYDGNYGADSVITNVPSGTINRVLQSPCIPAGPFNECTELFPCQNGAECVDLESGYECLCVGDYTGTNCQLLNECLSTPCLNGGVCTDLVDGYNCACPAGTLGDNCENYYQPPSGCECSPVVHPTWGSISYCAEWGGYDGFCYVTGDCGQLGSQAIPGAQWQYCDVVTGPTTTGNPTTARPTGEPTVKIPTPEPSRNPSRSPIQSPCTLYPCYNGGTCIETGVTSRVCECEVNFDGSSCETEMVPPDGCQCIPIQHPSSIVGFVDRCTNHLLDSGFESWCYVSGSCAGQIPSQAVQGSNWALCVPRGSLTPSEIPTVSPTTDSPTFTPTSLPFAQGCQNYKILTRTRSKGSENSWEVLGADCQSDQTYQSYRDYSQTCCLLPGDYEVSCRDSGNNGWNSGFVRFENEHGSKNQQECSGWWTESDRRFILSVERPFYASEFFEMSPSSRHELSGNADESLHFKVSLNEEVEYYLWAIYLQVGTGSANLYIRQTYEPSTTQSDCNPQKSAEGFLICYFHCRPGGTFWVLVHGVTDFDGYSMSMDMIQVPPDGESCPANGFHNGR